MTATKSALVWYPGHDLLVGDIVRARNCHLYDSAGKRYLDLESGVWCTSIGHGHPKIVQTIAEQSAAIAHSGFGYSSRIVEMSAKDILALMGFEDGKCVFLCSGSEAVEFAARTAQSITNRPLLMTMADSYFGAYGTASQQQSEEWFVFDWTKCATCSDPGRCDAQCELWRSIPVDDLGGFLFEPGSSSGLVRFPPDKLIHSIIATVRQNDGLVLVNEVTTGVGRTGLWFGYQHYGITPDIVAMGKGIGNGYPVSVAAFAPGVIDRLGDRPIKYAQSHQNDPLGAAVARRVIEVITEEGLVERGRKIGSSLYSGLAAIRERTGLISGIRSRGLMTALDINETPEGASTVRIHRELARRGYLLGKRPDLNVLRLDPSLTIDVNDCEAFLAAFEAILNDERKASS